MNTESTLSTKVFKLADGSKIVLPGTIPELQERKFINERWLPQGCKNARGIFAMGLQELLNGVIHELPDDFDITDPENADAVAEMRATEWEVLQEAFQLEYGRTWYEDITLELTPDNDPDKPTPLSNDDLELVGWMRSVDGPFERVDPKRWSDLVGGACSSRRAGVPLNVWAERTFNGGHWHIGAVGYAAQIAWTMPENELFRYGIR